MAQDRNLPVADHIHVGRSRIKQDILLRIAEALISSPHLGFGRGDIVPGLEAVEHGLPYLDTEKTDKQIGGGVSQSQSQWRIGLRIVDIGRALDYRPVTRFRDSHPFVGDAHARARRVQLRIELIRLRQRSTNGLRKNNGRA